MYLQDCSLCTYMFSYQEIASYYLLALPMVPRAIEMNVNGALVHTYFWYFGIFLFW